MPSPCDANHAPEVPLPSSFAPLPWPSEPPAAGNGRTRASGVYDRLRRDILECRLKPGARLRFEELRASYDVGLSPLREALMKLAAERLVMLEEHKGFRVAPISRDDLLDVAGMRKELEATAIRRSIERGDDSWEAQIVASVHQLAKRTKIGADGLVDNEWEIRHRAFHQALVAACGSPWLLHFRDLLYDQADRYRRLSVQYLRTPRDDLGEHRGIADAVLARDADAATRLIRQHFDRTVQTVLAGDSTLFEETAREMGAEDTGRRRA
jgi:DNA-binding GntR family transcriptional regulator